MPVSTSPSVVVVVGEEQSEQEHDPTACPICLDVGGTVNVCPRKHRPCNSLYHPSCAEGLHDSPCPTCRAPRTKPGGGRESEAPPPTPPQTPPVAELPLHPCCYRVVYPLVTLFSGYILCGVFFGAAVLACTGSSTKIFPRDLQFNSSLGSCLAIRSEHPYIGDADWDEVVSDIRANDGHTNVVVVRKEDGDRNVYASVHAVSVFLDKRDYRITWKDNPSTMLSVHSIDGRRPTREITFDPWSEDFGAQSFMGFTVFVICVGLLTIGSGCVDDYGAAGARRAVWPSR